MKHHATHIHHNRQPLIINHHLSIINS